VSKAQSSETLSRIFIPICKIDEEKRLVYGKMTFEAEDASGEIWDYAGSKPYFEQWSANAEKTSGGKSLGNLRVMHQQIAAGKLTQFLLDDDSKCVEIAAKVVDDGEWGKVLEGVYTGFSQGGRYVKRWKDPDDNTKTRYISDPVEVSLVDLPCLPGATFQYVKADGSVELRKFSTRETAMYEPTNEDIAARAASLAKAAGDETKWTDQVEKARDELVAEHEAALRAAEAEPAAVEEPAAEITEKVAGGEPTGEEESAPIEDSANEISAEDAEKARKAARERLSQVWKTTDGRTFGKCDEAVTHETTLPEAPPLSPVEAALKAAKGDEAPADGVVVVEKFVPTEGLDVAKTVIMGLVEKGLYSASRALEVLDSVIGLQQCSAWEEEYEGDGSGVPVALADAARSLGAAALAMCQEEVAEALSDLGGDDVEIDVYLSENEIFVENAAATEFVKSVFGDEELMKIGARNAAADQTRVQKVHDTSVELGADCGEEDAEKLAKMAESNPVIKSLIDKNAELSGEVEKALGGITELGENLKKAREEIEALRAKPAPMAPRTSVVGKTVDNGGGAGEIDPIAAETMITELSKTQDGRRMLAEAAIRASQAAGGVTN
jgi:hypothetical protein